MLDFRSRKKVAKRNSSRLIALVVSVYTATAIVSGTALGYAMAIALMSTGWVSRNIGHKNDGTIGIVAPEGSLASILPSGNWILWYCSLAGIAVVAVWLIAATAYHRRRLQKHGGWAVGLLCGARWIETPNNEQEVRLNNIVEELSILYQTSPPAVFVLDHERGINTLAAGLTPQDSIIAVTDGALRYLNREQLQGVIAHEFSHLVNGDTVMATRVSSIIWALNQIYLTANWLTEVGGDMALQWRNRETSSLGCFAILFGVCLYPFGLVGTFGAMLLSIELCRTREELADAEAVARLKNPKGLADALRKVLGCHDGGRLGHSQSKILAPMLFVSSTRSQHWFSTHPLIDRRIRAIDPNGEVKPIPVGSDLRSAVDNSAPHDTKVLQTFFPAAGTQSRLHDASIADAKASSAADAVAPTIDVVAREVTNLPRSLVGVLSHGESMGFAIPLLLGLQQSHANLDETVLTAVDEASERQRFAMLLAICSFARKLNTADKSSMASQVAQIDRMTNEGDWKSSAWIWLYLRALDGSGTEQVARDIPFQDAAHTVLSVIACCDRCDSMADYEFSRGWVAMGYEHRPRIASDELTFGDFHDALSAIHPVDGCDSQRLIEAIALVVSADSAVKPCEAVLCEVIRVHWNLDSGILMPDAELENV